MPARNLPVAIPMRWRRTPVFSGGNKRFEGPLRRSEMAAVLSRRHRYRSRNGAEIPDNLQVLVLHYAIQASAAEPTGKKISYKELPGGDIYIEPFTGRCIRPLIGIFAADLEAFERAVSLCPGQKETLGDSSYTVFVMPKIPITLVLYAADEEFPANGNILFDAAAAHFLSTEDYAVLCSALVGRLKKLGKQG